MDFTEQKKEVKALLKSNNIRGLVKTTYNSINVILKTKGIFDFPNIRNGRSFNPNFNNELPEATENFIKKIHVILSKNIKTIFNDNANQETIPNYYFSVQAQFN